MRWRAGLGVMALLLSGGCSKEPSFDEAFNQHAADIEARADGMQRDLTNQLNASAAAGAVEQGPPLANDGLPDE